MAVLHVKSPNGTDYNMTIVTSGTTESIEFNGWYRFPSGLLMQWGSTGAVNGWNTWLEWPIAFSDIFIIEALGQTDTNYGSALMSVYGMYGAGITGHLFSVDGGGHGSVALRTGSETGPSAMVLGLGL